MGTHEHDEDIEETTAQAPGGGNTLLESLRRTREEIGSNRTEDFPIPGYHGRLVIRVKYNQNLWDQFKRIGQRVDKSKNKRKELYAFADTIVLATEQVMVMKDDEPHPLGECFPEFIPVPEDRDQPISFADSILDRMFDLRRPDGTLIADAEDRSAREACLALFNNPLAVTNVHNQVADWLQGSSEDDEEFLGESSGAQR